MMGMSSRTPISHPFEEKTAVVPFAEVLIIDVKVGARKRETPAQPTITLHHRGLSRIRSLVSSDYISRNPPVRNSIRLGPSF